MVEMVQHLVWNRHINLLVGTAGFLFPWQLCNSFLIQQFLGGGSFGSVVIALLWGVYKDYTPQRSTTTTKRVVVSRYPTDARTDGFVHLNN